MPGAPGCGLSSAAFCDTFDTAHPTAGTRSGDLDASLWGISRISTGHTNISQNELNDWLTPVGYVTCNPPSGNHCSSGTKVPGVNFTQTPGDVKVVNGRLFEAVADGGDTKTQLEMYPKQPFDWNGRTGNIVFDVSMDSDSPHAAWPEIWITDRPVPATVPSDPLFPNAKNSIGFTLAGSPGCAGLGVDGFAQTVNYATSFLPIDNQSCLHQLTHASTTGALTHIHAVITSTSLKVYGKGPGDPAEQLIGSTTFSPINFTKGLVWLTDAHYNACKFDLQCDHVFAWDNFGFDGPKTYRDVTYDVPDALTASDEGAGWNGLGYRITTGTSRTLTTGQTVATPVQAPTACAVLFNANPTQGTVPDVQVNGHTVVHTAWPGFEAQDILKAFDVVVPCSDVQYGVPNTITFKGTNPGQDIFVTNVDLLLVAAAPVP